MVLKNRRDPFQLSIISVAVLRFNLLPIELMLPLQPVH